MTKVEGQRSNFFTAAGVEAIIGAILLTITIIIVAIAYEYFIAWFLIIPVVFLFQAWFLLSYPKLAVEVFDDRIICHKPNRIITYDEIDYVEDYVHLPAWWNIIERRAHKGRAHSFGEGTVAIHLKDGKTIEIKHIMNRKEIRDAITQILMTRVAYAIKRGR